jgi:hypothetical protein
MPRPILGQIDPRGRSDLMPDLIDELPVLPASCASAIVLPVIGVVE